MKSPRRSDRVVSPAMPWRVRVPLARWVLALVALGGFWRILRYALGMPIWGDEAYIGLNLLNRDMAGLLQPLDHCQVAPPLFLWAEWLMLHWWGMSEYALRLLPLLAGLAALGLFWRWSRLLLPPLGAAVAVGFLAVGYYPVRHSVELKPYSFDMLAAVALLLPATMFLRQPQRVGAIVVLLVLVPLCVGASYPAVFVAGGVSVALLVGLLRQRRVAPWLLWGLYNLVLVGVFLLVLWGVSSGQYQETGKTMRNYWSEAFPPHGVRALLWLVEIHTGNLMAYPVGGNHFGSTGTFLLVLVGIAGLVHFRRPDFLILLLAPFALTLVAAFLGRYPYGGSARVALHLAPAICLLAGAGVAVLIRLARVALMRQWITAGVCVALMVLGVAGMIVDVRKPYKTLADARVRMLVDEAFRRVGPRDPILVLEEKNAVDATFQWYLRREESRIVWGAAGLPQWDVPADARAFELLSFTHDIDLLTQAEAHHFPTGGWSSINRGYDALQTRPVQEGLTYYTWMLLER